MAAACGLVKDYPPVRSSLIAPMMRTSFTM
jgi:hypothetical protein